MEYKVKAIVISSKDYKEKDKLITLFSVEKGKINAIVKGVKNPNAKLKFCKELFCFGEYVLTHGKAGDIVVSCELIENFDNIIKNPDKYFEACYIVSALKNAIQYNEQNLELFIELINALKTLNTHEKLNKNIVASKFIVDILSAIGYKLTLNKCAVCGSDFYGKKYLIVETGEIVCSACKMLQTIELDDVVYSNMRILSNISYDKLQTTNLKKIDETLSILNINFNAKFGTKIQFY